MNLDNLDIGIKLERSGDTLLWGSPLDALLKQGSPTVIKKEDRTILEWKNEQILNGIKGDVEALFWKDEQKSLSKLEMNFLEEATDFFRIISNHLLNLLGAPNKVIDEDDSDRFWEWEFNTIKISISLFEMHQYRCSLVIAKTEN